MSDMGKEEVEIAKKYVKKYWKYLPLVAAGTIVAVLGAILVAVWFIQNNPLGGYGTWTFDQWSVHGVVTFVIFLILWELLLVGLPTLAYFGIGFFLFWTRVLTQEERDEMKQRNEQQKTGRKAAKYSGGGGGGFSFFMMLISLLLIYLDGNWFTLFGALSYGYFVAIGLWTLFYVAMFFGIPLAVIGILWVRHELRDIQV